MWPGERSPESLPSEHANLTNELAEVTVGLSGSQKTIVAHKLIMERLLGLEGQKQTKWQSEYRRLFKAAYRNKSIGELTIVDLGNAIAHFEEIAFSTRDTAWDRYVAGDATVISNVAKHGAILFYGKAKCGVCHKGPLYSDFEFHSLGVKQSGPGVDLSGEDFGRFHVTNDPRDKYKFRTPPLRNVTLTAPYFHDGVTATLREVITHHLDPLSRADKYEDSGVFTMNIEQIKSVSCVLSQGVSLSELETSALLEFLKTLEDFPSKIIDQIIPESVPSGLPVSRMVSD
jgi:cytochrome c peroxidase